MWERAWAAHATDEILALYAPDATLSSHPFREVQSAAEYLVPTLADEEATVCRFGEPIVHGDRAAIEWSAEIVLRNGERQDIAGVSLLRFTSDGSVREQRDFWAQR